MRAFSLIAPNLYDAFFIGIGLFLLLTVLFSSFPHLVHFVLLVLFVGGSPLPFQSFPLGEKRVVLHLRHLSIEGLLVLVGSLYHFGFLVQLFPWG